MANPTTAEWITAAATVITVPVVIAATLYARAANLSNAPFPVIQARHDGPIHIDIAGNEHGLWELVRISILNPGITFMQAVIEDSFDGAFARGNDLGRVLKQPQPGLFMLSVGPELFKTISFRAIWRHRMSPIMLRRRANINVTPA